MKRAEKDQLKITICLAEFFKENIEKYLLPFLKEKGLKVTSITRDEKLADSDEIIRKLSDTDIAVIGTEKIDTKVIENLTNLKLICCSGGGLDHIDLESAAGAGIKVTHVPEANTNAVAEFAIAVLLDRMRRVSESYSYVKAGYWPLLVGKHYEDITVGIVGLGKIGMNVAQKAVTMGFQVIGYDIVSPKVNNILLTDFDTLIKKSDAILIHVPLVEGTRNLFTMQVFKKMSRKPIIINLSRGGIVNEQDLYDAILRGMISGAAIDVFETEPLPANSPLLELGIDKILITPHSAASTNEAVKEVVLTIRDQISAFIAGKEPSYCVAK